MSTSDCGGWTLQEQAAYDKEVRRLQGIRNARLKGDIAGLLVECREVKDDLNREMAVGYAASAELLIGMAIACLKADEDGRP